ncbi:retrovirus-related Pol polyprotein from transposon 17.6 [Trichonephila clavata]|uniref:Retrovirus-related Pol polyprotein from transposon 17.6 n=1 Tax=Trichonephila clavata TaxID=2740835 RepID=A0A8X6KV87_TRICU|nr:retrovirus-related Pol polyprotein from transposon 17.6 [Trichonephila clavata]
MLAYMDRTTNTTSVASGVSEPRMLLGFTINDLTILIGAAIGAAGLILVILTAIIIWHCCRFRGRPDKAYCLDNSSPDEGSIKQGNGTMIHSDSVVFLGTKSNQVSTRTIGIKNDLCQSILTRSQSVPLKEGKELPKVNPVSRQFSKKRPVSQPVHLPIAFQPASYSPKRVHPQNYRHLEDASLGLPSIPEMAFRSSEILQDAPPQNLYASCNALDGPCVYSSLYTTVNANTTMKTRSLPLWGRSKPRPLSTEDDLNELYAKVNNSNDAFGKITLSSAFGENVEAKLIKTSITIDNNSLNHPMDCLVAIMDKLNAEALIPPSLYEALCSINNETNENDIFAESVDSFTPFSNDENDAESENKIFYVESDSDNLNFNSDYSKMKDEQNNCDSLKKVRAELKLNKGNFLLVEELIYHRDKILNEPVMQLVLPRCRIDKVMKLAHELLYGREARGPLAILKSSWAGEIHLLTNISQSAADYLQEMKIKMEKAAESASLTAAQKQKSYGDYFNKRSSVKNFSIGEQVVLLIPDSSNKIYARWTGPGEIMQHHPPHSYKVKLPDGTVRHVHVNKIRKYHPRALAVIFEDDHKFGEIHPTPNLSRSTSERVIHETDLNHLKETEREQVYSELVYPLTELTKKRVPDSIPWTEKHDFSFHLLKKALAEAPSLYSPVPDKSYTIHSDASQIGIAACLSQKCGDKCYPIAYASQKLSKTQQSWSTIERETFAIVWSLKKFAVWVFGTEIEFYTDHNPLPYLTKSAPQSARLQRWAFALQKFNVTIKYCPGVKMPHADALTISVSFSKKRKNRMRSDSAAAIAVNKSRTSYLTIPFTHKDTDSLVDNEAVVVYDERTAL